MQSQLLIACNPTSRSWSAISPQPTLTQREFALKHMPDYPLFKMCSDLYDVVPDVLTKTGKVG